MRLKGGDPFVFGRGGEEAQLLRAAGIDVEVVPGVTAGVAAPAYAGIPVTQRGMAAAVAFVTGHEDPGKDETQVDWPALAAFPGTLVFYMGVRKLDRIAEQLVAGGRPRERAGGGRRARHVRRPAHGDAGRSPTSRARAAQAGVRAPAITVVGPVAALHEELAWFAAGPLAGAAASPSRAPGRRRARSPRGSSRSARTSSRRRRSASSRCDAALPADLAAYDLLCVTSPNGARRLLEIARDARALAGPAIAAIGPGTADALRAGGIEPDIVPPRAVAESLVEALAERPVKRALIARAEQAREVLPDALRERGAEVEILALYRTVARAAVGGRARVRARRRLRHVHLGVVGALLPRGGGRADGRPADRLDRPGHERRAARARARAVDVEAARAHARRPDRGAARRRRRAPLIGRTCPASASTS